MKLERRKTKEDEPKEDGKALAKTVGQSVKEWTKSILIALVIWFFLRSLLIEAFRIPSGSMENTLLVGDFLFVNKALYGAEVPVVHEKFPAFREPKRYDIVVFNSPIQPGVNVVKRLVGMPGDTLSMEDNILYVDGRALDEKYVIRTDPMHDPEDPRMRAWQLHYLVNRDSRSYRPTLKNWGPIVVPLDSFFVMGDNRDNSLDSRYWGFLGRDRLEGSPIFIYWSYDKNGLLPLPFFTEVRWDRIFSRPK